MRINFIDPPAKMRSGLARLLGKFVAVFFDEFILPDVNKTFADW